MSKSATAIKAGAAKAQIKSVKLVTRTYKFLNEKAAIRMSQEPSLPQRQAIQLSGMDRRIAEARAALLENR